VALAGAIGYEMHLPKASDEMKKASPIRLTLTANMKNLF